MNRILGKVSRFGVSKTSLEGCIEGLSEKLSIPKEKVVGVLLEYITENENENLKVEFVKDKIVITSPDDDLVTWIYDLLELKGEYDDKTVSITFPISKLANVMAYILFGKLYTDEDLLGGVVACDQLYTNTWFRGFINHLRVATSGRGPYSHERVNISTFLEDIRLYKSPIGDPRICKRELDRYITLINYTRGRTFLFSLEVEMLISMFARIDEYELLPSSNHTYSRGDRTGTRTIITGGEMFVATEVDKLRRGLNSLQRIRVMKDEGVTLVVVTAK